MIHKEAHPKAGQTVRLVETIKHPQVDLAGKEFRVEDWWDRIAGKSWGVCDGNPACLVYALRTGFSKTPIPSDDEVVYGKVEGGSGTLIHVSEIATDGAE